MHHRLLTHPARHAIRKSISGELLASTLRIRRDTILGAVALVRFPHPPVVRFRP